MEMEQFYYDNKIVRNFVYATLFWGVIGMGVGLLLAYLFLFPTLTEGISWLSFGRLRPLHTNAVIFAFVEKTTSYLCGYLVLSGNFCCGSSTSYF